MKSGKVDNNPLSRFIVNEDAFKAIVSEIEGVTETSIPQPVIVVGEAGSGKTTLLQRLYESDGCREKSKIWIDGRSVFSSADIISKAAYVSVVFVDDIDFYFTRCTYDEQFKLRRFLYNEGAPMLIASVGKVQPAMTEYDAPFFEGLKNVYLPPVEDIDIKHLFAEHDTARMEAMLRLLPPTIKSVKIIDGIFRLNDNPKHDISNLLSLFGDTYRKSYEELPVKNQRILNALGEVDKALNIPELRKWTGLPTNELTPYLKTLENRGIIKTDKSVKRNTKYSMRDPLFKMWVREARGPVAIGSCL